MKLFISMCLFTLFILNAQPGFSQKEVEISGVKYLLHSVTKGETVYSLCLKYKVTQNELNEANPGLTAVLKSGSTIKIPIKKEIAEQKPEQSSIKTVATEPEFYYHKVKKKQTIFSIARQYDITANELIRYNPEISNGLIEGQVLKIPIRTKESAEPSGQPEQKIGNEKKTVSEVSSEAVFKLHTVVAGETLYSLEQKYGVTREELISLNPTLENGLETGTRLKIPVRKTQQTDEIEKPATSFEKYKVQKGETLFSLASRFGVEVVILKKANPSLFLRSLEVGETILIPKQPVTVNQSSLTQPTSILTVNDIGSLPPPNCLPLENFVQPAYKAALLLPLYLQGNDHVSPSELNTGIILSKINISNLSRQLNSGSTDTTALTTGANIDQRSDSFLEFYEGVLLAIDSLQQKGMKIELYVFDATNQKMINALLQLDVFRELNLIIGPVYPELQESVASFAAKNRIPMVSPLASTGNFEVNNSYYFKVNPTREYQIEQTANYIADEFSNKNFVFLPMSGSSNSPEAKLAELGKSKLLAARQSVNNGESLYHEYSFQKQGLNPVKPLLDETGENIFIIPTDNEAQVSVAVTNLNSLAEKYDVVLIGTSNLTKLKSIQTENYHHVRLRYLSPYFIDYTRPLVRRFVSQYRETFSGEPSQFSYQGFDVAYYFLSALFRYGKDFSSCLPGYPMELTQMEFSFRRVTPLGGFMNNGLFITAWERNYDIKNYGIVGGANSDK